MRLPKRMLLLVASSLAAVVMAGGGFVYQFANAYAASGTTAASYTGTYGVIGRAGSGTTVPKGVLPNLGGIACSNDTDINYTGSCAPNTGGDDGGTFTPNGNVSGAPYSTTSSFDHKGATLANFNGITDVDSHAVNGFHVTPPDQALCVGTAGPWEAAGLPLGVSPHTTVVWEGVNEAWTIYSTSGAVLYGPDTLVDLFGDPYASGDIGCRYDPATQSYFLTEIGVLLSGPDALNYSTDLAVVSPSGYAAYQPDTSVGTLCFPDFPQTGYDNEAFYLTVNEFCGNNNYSSAYLYAFSKSQLVALATSVNMVTFANLYIGAIPIVTLQPAFGDLGTTEYLVNSYPYDQNGNNLATANALGLWKVTGDWNITHGKGTVTLTGGNIASETYAFPVPAASSGTGAQFCYPAGGPPPCPANNDVIESEPYLNPDDSRLDQVQIVSTHQGLRLYTTLDTALNFRHSSSTVDGAAWFEIDPVGHHVTHQGYIGAAGTNLLYPSLMRSNSGELVLDFSLTSPTLNPSTGYVFGKASDYHFSSIQVTQVGSGPHVSFCDVVCGRPRWGDYSAASLDPSGTNIWVADEDVPPGPAGQDLVDNWGTQVWEVSGGY